jgi:hypothetical protein
VLSKVAEALHAKYPGECDPVPHASRTRADQPAPWGSSVMADGCAWLGTGVQGDNHRPAVCPVVRMVDIVRGLYVVVLPPPPSPPMCSDRQGARRVRPRQQQGQVARGCDCRVLAIVGRAINGRK